MRRIQRQRGARQQRLCRERVRRRASRFQAKHLRLCRALLRPLQRLGRMREGVRPGLQGRRTLLRVDGFHFPGRTPRLAMRRRAGQARRMAAPRRGMGTCRMPAVRGGRAVVQVRAAQTRGHWVRMMTRQPEQRSRAKLNGRGWPKDRGRPRTIVRWRI
jgi:hypothetical protein